MSGAPHAVLSQWYVERRYTWRSPGLRLRAHLTALRLMFRPCERASQHQTLSIANAANAQGCTQSRSNSISVTPPPGSSSGLPPPPSSARSAPPRAGASHRTPRSTVAGSSSNHTPTAQWNDAPAAPLQRPKPWRSSSRTWTRSALQRERIAFWDTRVQGRSECWAALKLAIDLCSNNGGAGDGLKEAHAIVVAAGLKCETGRLSEGAWDEAGHLYKLPRWVVSDPTNIVEDGGISLAEMDGEEQATDDDADAVEKDGAVEGEKMTLRARLSDRGKDAVIRIEKNEKVRGVIKKVKAAGKLSDGTAVRVAYMGKILKENETLSAQGWAEGHVVNALVFTEVQK